MWAQQIPTCVSSRGPTHNRIKVNLISWNERCRNKTSTELGLNGFGTCLYNNNYLQRKKIGHCCPFRTFMTCCLELSRKWQGCTCRGLSTCTYYGRGSVISKHHALEWYMVLKTQLQWTHFLHLNVPTLVHQPSSWSPNLRCSVALSSQCQKSPGTMTLNTTFTESVPLSPGRSSTPAPDLHEKKGGKALKLNLVGESLTLHITQTDH